MAKLHNVFNSDKFSSSFVNVNSCARVHLIDKDRPTEREKGRSDYLLMYNARGKCYATVDGVQYTVGQNEAFLYHPHEPQNYCFYKKDKTINYWVHFTGVEIDNIISSLGLSDVHYLKLNLDPFEIENMFSRICREFNQKDVFYEEICSGLLIAILSIMSRSLTKKSEAKMSYDFVEYILGEFHSSPREHYVIEDLAEEYSITTNHLIKTFKNATGKTPKQYMIYYKMNKAKELLLYTDNTLSEIAASVGYPSISYFSRLFKKNFGVSPTEFRKGKK